MANDVIPKFKVVLLGEGCVGKTCMVLRFVENKFVSKHQSTLQAAFFTKTVQYDNQKAELNIWDTAGQERFHALGPIYYRNSNGAILVYDITDQDSFEKVKSWVKELRKMLGNEVRLSIAGNKSDLEKNRTVNQSEAESFAKMANATHFSTSAKSNEGIDELFACLTTDMLKDWQASSANRQPSNMRKKPSDVINASSRENMAPKSKCCA